MLIAFEGLDQSGKETQARHLRARIEQDRKVHPLSFPDYETPIGREIAKALAAASESNMIVFGPANAKMTVTVFTDIDCGYCRKLHGEIDGYLAEGIKVRYLFFPRSGVGTPSFDKAISVWCADDRKAALTDAKAGKSIPDKKCDNPVKEQMELGEKLGVSGTPAIILESGEMVPGYVPPKRLATMIKDGKS